MALLQQSTIMHAALRFGDVSDIAGIVRPIATDSIAQTLLEVCCRGVAIHKTYSFQIHLLYFASPEPPPGQDRQSWFAYNTAPTHGTLSCGTIWASGDQRRALLANDARFIAMRAVVSMALPTAVLAAGRLLTVLMWAGLISFSNISDVGPSR